MGDLTLGKINAIRYFIDDVSKTRIKKDLLNALDVIESQQAELDRLRELDAEVRAFLESSMSETDISDLIEGYREIGQRMMQETMQITIKQGQTYVEMASVLGIIGCGTDLDEALDDLHEKLMDPELGRMHTSSALHYVERLRNVTSRRSADE